MEITPDSKEIRVDLQHYLRDRRDILNQALSVLIDNASEKAPLTEPLIVRAMAHSLMAGGKRLRPILCMAACEALGGDPKTIIPAACALEMIHTYSLIHDDLPAMDDDALRRGKPTCHVAFDEATAILAGDALLTLGFETLAAAGCNAGAQPQPWLTVIRLISMAAGHKGMIAGQMQDISFEGAAIGADELEAMHRLKTGALIRAAVLSGATLGNAPDALYQGLTSYGNHIGLAFQVADDILNVEGDPQRLGKAVGTDCLRRKQTYPALLGLAASKRLAADLVDAALRSLKIFDNRADPLRAIAVYIVKRSR